MASLAEFLSMPMDALPGGGIAYGYDEAGNPIRRGALGGEYIVKPQANAQAAQRQATGQALLTAAMQGRPFDPGTYQAQQNTPLSAAMGDLAQGALQGITAPGRAARGEPLTMADVMATALDWGAMGATGAAPKGSTRMFAGRNANTANLDAMAKAEKMLNQGVNRDEVWRETGWMRGADGKMRFEIDDSAAQLSDRALGVSLNAGSNRNADVLTNYRGALQHYDLEGAYDMMNDVDLRHGSPAGSYYPDDGRMIFRADNPQEMRSIALHETQHHIQGLEGFAQGASPGDMALAHMQVTKKAQDHYDALALLQEVERTGDWTQALKDFDDIGASVGAEGQHLARQFGDVRTARKALDEVVAAKEKLEPLREVGQWQQDTGYGPYRRVAGEVEARNVQARRNFTPEQRKEIPPWQTQDVPEERQIMVRSNQVNLSADGGGNLIEIVRKYGIAGAAAMLGMSQAELQAQMDGS